jgi:hypothetical protein
MELTILGGNLTATGSGGAGIGSGNGDRGDSVVVDLTIADGSIKASGSNGAGIGSGYGYDHLAYRGGSAKVHNLTITGGSIDATGSNGAGIGSGYSYNGNSAVDSVVISGGYVSASGSNGAGIGSGYASGGWSTVQNLTISGGDMDATGSNGAGIGSGLIDSWGSSAVSELVIVNGSFRVRSLSSHAGIGFGPARGTGPITVFNGFFDCSGVSANSCFNSSSLTFRDGNATAITNYRTVGPSSNSQVSGSSSLYFEYLSDSNRELLQVFQYFISP